MKSPFKSLSLLFLIFSFFAVQVLAQDEGKSELFIMHQDVVKIDKIAEYEGYVKELFDLWKKHGMEVTVKHASKTSDNKYNFLTPLKSYADLDKHNTYWENFSKKVDKDRIESLMKKMDATYSSHKNVIIRKSHDLSYWPEDDRMKGETTKYLHFAHFQFKLGHMDKANKLMKEYKDLMIKKKNRDGYTVWVSDIGGDMGQVVVVRWAKDPIDFHTASKSRNDSVADEIKTLRNNFGKVLTSYSSNTGKPMPEFVYMPEN